MLYTKKNYLGTDVDNPWMMMDGWMMDRNNSRAAASLICSAAEHVTEAMHDGSAARAATQRDNVGNLILVQKGCY